MVAGAQKGEVVLGGEAAVGPVPNAAGVAAGCADGAAGARAALIADFQPAAERDAGQPPTRLTGSFGGPGDQGAGGVDGMRRDDRVASEASGHVRADGFGVDRVVVEAAERSRGDQQLHLRGWGVAGGEVDEGVGTPLVGGASVV